MYKRLAVMLALIAALALGTPNLMADHGKDKDRGKGNPHASKKFNDDDKWERRDDGYEYRAYGGGRDVPPGWSHGKKTGWGNCGMPPGQAKKYGCRSYVYQGRTHYYYRDDRGRIIVRRPVISVHGGVDVHP
ncbi:MAG TPA: hypothetical protein VMT28_04815 [Terriglobales bacterium]|jgi:hypothetical protein|nr:hypothetical protein [Terriglobales bacterium]